MHKGAPCKFLAGIIKRLLEFLLPQFTIVTEPSQHNAVDFLTMGALSRSMSVLFGKLHSTALHLVWRLQQGFCLVISRVQDGVSLRRKLHHGHFSILNEGVVGHTDLA